MAEYDDAMARYYDVDILDTGGDVPFYVEEAVKAGSPVLELGCGTGRVTIPIAQAGVRIVGLDCSAGMLDIAREKVHALGPEVRERIELLEADMRSFSLGRQFSLVTIPYRGFMHLLTTDDQKRALGCIRSHIGDGGRLVFNVFDPRIDAISAQMSAGPAACSRVEYVRPDTGRRVIRTIPVTYDAGSQLAHCEFAYEELDDSGEVLSRCSAPVDIRWTYRYEMEHLLNLCGFEIEALYGDFRRGPYRYGWEQIWICRRA